MVEGQPVLMIGNISGVISMLLFGFAANYRQAALSRILGGAFNFQFGWG